MIAHTQLVQARAMLVERAISFVATQPGVIGIFLAGSLPAGSADAYSDIDLQIIATPEGQARLLAGRLEWPSHWGDLLFNEWLDGTQHCMSHFRPFSKDRCLLLDARHLQALALVQDARQSVPGPR